MQKAKEGIRSKRKRRCEDALAILTREGRATFFTLTTPDVVEYPEIRARWCRLRLYMLQDMRRRGLNPQFVMNYERHPGYLQKVLNADTFDEEIIRSDGIPHGWHIHGVMSCRIELRRYLGAMHAYGFGRVDVRPVTSIGVAEYLTKHALKAYRGISRREREKNGVQRLRLVSCSRGMPALHDYRTESGYLDLARYLMSLQVAEIKRAGDKVSNAIAIWKKAEVAAMLYGTSYYEK